MLGKSSMTSNQTMDSRIFIYEVEGLSQNDQTSQAVSPIRNSSALLFPVPHSRMNSFMQRMNRLGGKIVAIHSSWDTAVGSGPTDAESSDSAD